GEGVEADHALVRPVVTWIELRKRETAAKRKSVFAFDPDRIRGRHPTVLKDTGESALRHGTFADAHRGAKDLIRVVKIAEPFARIAEVVGDGHSGKERRTKRVDRQCRGRNTRERRQRCSLLRETCRREWLVDRAVNLLANEAEHFYDIKVW